MPRPSSHADSVLTIDLGAVVANYLALRDRLSGAECAAVVKADAYGLGAACVAPELAAAGCRTYFVATLDEGIALRAIFDGLQPAGQARLFVLNGASPGTEEEFYEHRLIPVLNSEPQVDAWATVARRRGASRAAALHLDTGMARLGLSPSEADALAGEPDRLAAIDLVLVMSHLACADEPDHSMNRQQLTRFRRLRDAWPSTPASLANSSGIFLGADYLFDMGRAGVALYGVNPQPDQTNPMAQVVNIKGKILQVRDVDSPMTVGYGATHLVARPGRIATVPVGYADGWPRALSNRGFAYVGDIRVPLVGRVSMDLITLDVTDVPPHLVQPGCEVELLGGRAAIDEVAKVADTIAYELLTRLGQRHERVYVGISA